ncbi:MAG: hypothetical protein HOJ14_07005 [Nitrospina sp.]|nr:hypothetical protein [Nitrospina sp.]
MAFPNFVHGQSVRRNSKKQRNEMDYVFKAIGIAFIVSVVLFIFNALKMQHDSNRFSTSKDDSKKKENDK